MSVSLPRVAACVPVHGDAIGLRRCLEALAAQDWPAAGLQVVVAVDGPDPACEAIARDAGVDVVVLPTQRGSYAARNAALDRVDADVSIVAFTDADCRPAPGWVRGHVSALAGADLSGGAVAISVRPEPSPAEFLDSVVHLQQQAYVEQQGYAATANLAARRSVIDALRFDDRLRTGGDVELCERAARAGWTLVYAPDAVVDHPARRTTRAVLRKTRRICRGMAARPERWRDRKLAPLFPVRDALWPVARARRTGRSSGVTWDARLAALVYLRLVLMRVAAWRVRRLRPSGGGYA